MKNYPSQVQEMHDTELIPYCETVSVVIEKEGTDANLPDDDTLQKRTVIGLIANVQDAAGKGYNQNAVKLLDAERTANAYLELWDRNSQNVITIPLRELVSTNIKGKYVKIHQCGFMPTKSKIKFGKVTTATEKQAIDLIFVCAD
jgi:hypothetical protein